MRASVAGLFLAILTSGLAPAQYVISAHSGMVQYVEGSAYLNDEDEKVEPKAGQFPEIKQNQVFRTEEGKAEILLTPGVFLRLGENSSIRMISSQLADTRVEVRAGSAMVECDDLQKDNAIMLLYKGSSVILTKRGVYRVDATLGLFKVYDGEAIVKDDSGQLTLHKGKQTVVNGALMAERFDPKADDDLYRWSDRRSGYLAKANISSANSLNSSNGGPGYGGSGYVGSGYGWNPWQFNPMFGMYTFVPYDGFLFSPFGYGFWSPSTVWQAPNYNGARYFGGGSGGLGSPRKASTNGSSTAIARSGGSSASLRGGSAMATSSAGHASSGGGHR
jgi:hypothetical protein